MFSSAIQWEVWLLPICMCNIILMLSLWKVRIHGTLISMFLVTFIFFALGPGFDSDLRWLCTISGRYTVHCTISVYLTVHNRVSSVFWFPPKIGQLENRLKEIYSRSECVCACVCALVCVLCSGRPSHLGCIAVSYTIFLRLCNRGQNKAV